MISNVRALFFGNAYNIGASHGMIVRRFSLLHVRLVDSLARVRHTRV